MYVRHYHLNKVLPPLEMGWRKKNEKKNEIEKDHLSSCSKSIAPTRSPFNRTFVDRAN